MYYGNFDIIRNGKRVAVTELNWLDRIFLVDRDDPTKGVMNPAHPERHQLFEYRNAGKVEPVFTKAESAILRKQSKERLKT